MSETAPLWKMLPRLARERAPEGRAKKPATLKDAAEALAQAQAQAEETLLSAHAEASSIREEALQQGYSSGLTAARQEVEAQLRQAWDARTAALSSDVQAVIDSIIAQRETLWTKNERDMVSLVFEIARKVIKTEVKENPEVIGEMVRHAMRRIVDKDNIRIRVNTEEVDAIRAQREDLMHVLDGIRNLEIVGDRRIGRGGCVIETDAGTIDARIDTQVAQVDKALEAA